MSKSPDAFRTISEVAEWLSVPAHVLRFWESRFTQIRPVKRAGGRRYYRPADMELLGGIKRLLHDDGLTIRGVQKLLREEGVRHVSALSPVLKHPGASPFAEDNGTQDAARDNVVALSPPTTASRPPADAAAVVPDAASTRSHCGMRAALEGEETDRAEGTHDGAPPHPAVAPPPDRTSVLATLLAIDGRHSPARAERLAAILDRARSLARTMDARE